MAKLILWIVTVLSFLACAYSFLGLMMVAMLSAAPNYSPERAQFNANFWGSCTIILLVLGVVFAVLTWKGGKKRRKSSS